MPRKPRNQNKNKQHQSDNNGNFTKNQIIDMVRKSDLENIVVVGTDKDGMMGLYSTIMAPGFIHHMLNDATVFVSTQSLSRQQTMAAQMQQKQLEEMQQDEEAPAIDNR